MTRHLKSNFTLQVSVLACVRAANCQTYAYDCMDVVAPFMSVVVSSLAIVEAFWGATPKGTTQGVDLERFASSHDRQLLLMEIVLSP
jgi:hypothetical protein